MKIFLLFVLIIYPFSWPYAARVERLIDTWQPQHYSVNITLNDQLSEIASASARIDILIRKPTATIDLDFRDLTIDSVTLASKPLQFTHSDGKLLINLTQRAEPGARLSITITYHGKPKDGLILTTDKAGKPAAVGDNWP